MITEAKWKIQRSVLNLPGLRAALRGSSAMKYVHGIDEKKHDLLMAWVNRLIFVVILFVFLFFLSFFVGILIYLFYYRGDKRALWGLLISIPGIAASLAGLFEAAWRNGRYFLNNQGLTLVYPLKSQFYPWSTFKKVFVSPIRRGERISSTYEYIVLIVSDCESKMNSFSVPECWRYRRKFVIVRSSEARILEFKKYCSFSERTTSGRNAN